MKIVCDIKDKKSLIFVRNNLMDFLYDCSYILGF